ncbi:MAG: hypothetical protein HFE49_03795, partial [Clostridia bacterium]|nr:hypothetical protein [Clostridia bacterium]
MRRRILSLFLALSMIVPITGAFQTVSSAENTDTEVYVNSDDTLMSEQADNEDVEMHVNSDDILTFDQTDNTDVIPAFDSMENNSRIQERGYETTVAYSGSAILSLEQYDAQLDAIAGQIGSADPSVLTENEEYVNVLLKRRLVDKIGYDRLAAKMNENADFAACMEWLFTDIQMLRYYSYGGEPEA